jgi:two-component system, sensor histidine kinase and response regulator
LESKHSTFSWNRSAALEFAGGDEDLLNEVVQIFLADSPGLMNRLQQAVLQNDAGRLERAAHSLCGALSYLAAPDACELARRLEAAGRNKQLECSWDVFNGLQIQMLMLWSALDAGSNA